MLSGAILSGGTGSRMGQEKGLTTFAGRPLVLHVVEAMRAVTEEVVIAVARGMGPIYRAVLGTDFVIVEDAGTVPSPLQGLLTSLGAASGEYVLVSPCDTPLLKPGVCRAIAAKAEGMDGAVPKVRGYIEPLHGTYLRTKARAVFQEAYDHGKLKVSDACGDLRLAIVEESVLRGVDPELDSFWNLNTPLDLELAEAKLRRARRAGATGPSCVSVSQ